MSRLNEREIARKLAERDKLEPPAGLLDRIKSEIPPSIPIGIGTPEAENHRSMPPRQRWLIAASLVVMVGAGLLALQVRMQATPVRETARSESILQRADRTPPSLPASPPPAARMSLPREAKPLAGAGRVLPPPPQPKPFLRQEAAGKSLGAIAPSAESGVEDGVVGGVPGGFAGGGEVQREPAPPMQPRAMPESAPAPAVPPQAPRGEAVSEAAPQRSAEALEVRERAKSSNAAVSRPAGVDPFKEALRQRLSTFEVDSGTASYMVARRSLLDGGLPDPGSIRVQEMVSSFDQDVAVKAEGAPTPFVQGSGYRLLRFDLSGLPSGARVQVDFNPAVVERYRLLGSGTTALYEIELRPGAPRDGRVATLRSGGRTGWERELALSALAPSWRAASPGFRLAALVAEFAEILQGSPWARADLAEIAREVRQDLPQSAKTSELADLMERAARIQRVRGGEE
jgi:hypothetical protein